MGEVGRGVQKCLGNAERCTTAFVWGCTSAELVWIQQTWLYFLNPAPP